MKTVLDIIFGVLLVVPAGIIYYGNDLPGTLFSNKKWALYTNIGCIATIIISAAVLFWVNNYWD